MIAVEASVNRYPTIVGDFNDRKINAFLSDLDCSTHRALRSDIQRRRILTRSGSRGSDDAENKEV